AAATLCRRCVRAAGWAVGLQKIVTKEQALALVAPPPISLIVRVSGLVVRQAVVAAATLCRRCVCAAGWAAGLENIVTEEQALALVAPPPVRLHPEQVCRYG